jgi:hypothetical protein
VFVSVCNIHMCMYVCVCVYGMYARTREAKLERRGARASSRMVLSDGFVWFISGL